jgi:hypothetical protein
LTDRQRLRGLPGNRNGGDRRLFNGERLPCRRHHSHCAGGTLAKRQGLSRDTGDGDRSRRRLSNRYRLRRRCGDRYRRRSALRKTDRLRTRQ